MVSISKLELTPRQRAGSFLALYSSSFTWGMSYAGLVPLMSLLLKDRGIDPVLIGFVAAANPIGVLLGAPIVAHILKRFGTANSIIASMVVGLATVLALPYLNSIWWWLLLRFVNGFSGAIPWVATETWINILATEKTRGRITALYGGVMAGGFATGPFLLTTFGIDGLLPFMSFAILIAISLVPIFIVRHLAPTLNLPKGTKLSNFFLVVPTIMGAGFLVGMTDTSLFSFLPIWAIGVGFKEDTAIHLLSIFVLGNVILTLPIGWLADKISKRRILIGCSSVCIIAPIFTTFTSDSLWIIGGVLFFWGGCAWSLYILGLAMLGDRFRGGTLAAANAAYVIAYEVANVLGPPMAGLAFKTWENYGLMVLLSLSAAIFTTIAIFRSASHKKKGADS